MEAEAKLNSHIIESLKGIETIKVLAGEEKNVEKLENQYIENLKIAFKEGVLSNVQGSVSQGISTIGNLVLMYIGATQVMNGNITLGSLMAFTSLSGYFMEPIGRLVNLQLSIQEASISLKRLSEIYEVEKEQAEDLQKEKISQINGDINQLILLVVVVSSGYGKYCLSINIKTTNFNEVRLDFMKICSVCKAEDLKEISITTRGTFEAVELKEGFAISPNKSKITKYVCLKCGHIDLYVKDLETFK